MNRTCLLLAVALGGLLLPANRVLAQTWTQTSAPTLNWHAVASSADGAKLVAAAAGPGPIVASTNSGLTWQPTGAPLMNWFSVASSADGTKLVATASSERPIYTSADSGATWTAATNELFAYYYSSVASSADGNRLVVGIYDGVHHGGQSLISTDAGITWTVLANGLAAVSVAMSADGARILAGAGPSGLGSFWSWFVISTNSGATWTETSVPSALWNAAASSVDGRKLAAANADGSGLIYTSEDSGTIWRTNLAAFGNWLSLASSADGITLIAAQGGCFTPGGPGCGGPVYTSPDAGATWISNNVPDAFAVAASADGNQLVAAVNGGGIWIWQSNSAPTLHIASSGSGLVLSWIVPSSDFVLQENSDLKTTNWTNVMSMPKLNLTDLQNEVPLSATNGNHFYRLLDSSASSGEQHLASHGFPSEP
jgi:hypothetical protein